jgi:hypothetical protein
VVRHRPRRFVKPDDRESDARAGNKGAIALFAICPAPAMREFNARQTMPISAKRRAVLYIAADIGQSVELPNSADTSGRNAGTQ